MRCPTLKQMPPPPPGKSGWPWTEESPQLADRMLDGLAWPRISIVTPSLNQAQFIEETIRSVLLQGYPDFEYVIMDGGSTDGAIDIIRKYEKWLTHWETHKDKGQSQAINEGFAKTTGRLCGYLNSDDLYEPGTFQIIGSLRELGDSIHLVAGECTFFGRQKENISKPWWPEDLLYYLEPLAASFAQPSVFWDRNSYELVGGLDESLNFCFDREFFLRLGLHGIKPKLLSNKLARYREHAGTKSRSKITEFFEESVHIVQKHANTLGLTERQSEKRVRQINKELKCITLFARWRQRGRFQAIIGFLSSFLSSPDLIFERRFIGLGRRLVFFRRKNVFELEKY